MLTPWAIALQSYGFTVQPKACKSHVAPDAVSRMFALEHQQKIALPSCAPICRNVPDCPTVSFKQCARPAHIRYRLQIGQFRASTQRHRYLVKSVFVSATNVLMSVDQEKLRSARAEEYGPYVDYIQKAEATLPEKETKTTMSYYQVQDGLLFKSFFRDTFEKGVHFAISCYYHQPLWV